MAQRGADMTEKVAMAPPTGRHCAAAPETVEGGSMSVITAMSDAVRAAVRGRLGERGASVVEYALLLTLVAVFCIGAVTLVGTQNAASLSSTASTLP